MYYLHTMVRVEGLERALDFYVDKLGLVEVNRRDLPAPRPGIYFVYAILCVNKAIYLGQTQDLQKRWIEHRDGKGAEYTRKNIPAHVIHYEEFHSREEAVAREKWLKTEFGRKWLQREWKAGRTRQAGDEKGRYTNVFLKAPNDDVDMQGKRAPLLELTYNWDEEKYSGGRNFGHLAYAVDNIYDYCVALMKKGIVINRPPRDGRMAFIRSPEGISIELLQIGEALPPQEPWASMSNTGTW
jgi:lactoylglutathione lyase